MSNVEGEQHASKPDWKYCAIGNIMETHLDEEEMLRRGTKAFAPGTKVYLYGKYWHASDTDITVIGLNRFGIMLWKLCRLNGSRTFASAKYTGRLCSTLCMIGNLMIAGGDISSATKRMLSGLLLCGISGNRFVE